MNMLSSFVGAWLAIVLVITAGVILIFGIVGNVVIGSGQTEQLKSRSILKIEISGVIGEVEQSGRPDFQSLMAGTISKPQSLNTIVEALREAARNKDIVGVYLDCGEVVASPATLNAIREEIIEFRKSRKPVYAYGDGMSMGSYYVASAADRIYLNPEGELFIQGMTTQVMYMKDLLDKLGIEFQVVKVGTFKSAVEPYIMNTMSEPARAQLDTLMNNMWLYIRQNISKNRKGVTPASIDSLVSVSNIAYADVKAAVAGGLVDSLIYERNIKNRFADITGKDADKVNFVSPATLVNQVAWGQGYNSKNRIAVLYACGEIQDGNDSPGYINYETLVPLIVKLADDENVKGMVLRVNSPGGSAFGSAQIGEALDYFQSKGKPLAVSMGDYAASGGYWISSCADRIFADPLTITGSIGIFGLIPNFSGTAQKLGLNMQTVSTNPGAVFPTGLKPMDERQLGVMQAYVERGYETFVSRVAKGRKMSVDAVKRIAEGRVWDAVTATRIGLVDSLGNLKNAVEWTARKADIYNKYDVALYPQFEPSFWDMVASNSNVMAEQISKVASPKPEELMYKKMREVLNRRKVQALMPELKVEFAR